MTYVPAMPVGTPAYPVAAYSSGGPDYIKGMILQHNTNGEAGVWVDITVPLTLVPGIQTPLYPAVTTGGCLYIGGDYKFYAIHVATAVAKVGGTLVMEYWDGVAWSPVTFMTASSFRPFEQYAKDIFGRVAHEYSRFNIELLENGSWVKKTLNGQNKYWIRYRITLDLATIPEATAIQLTPSRTQINADGSLEFFGEAIRETLRLPTEAFRPGVGAAPGSYNVDISASVRLNYVNNRFNNGADDRLGLVAEIPIGLATGRPVRVDVYWAEQGAVGIGNVELELITAVIREGILLDGARPETNHPVIIPIPVNKQNETRKTTFAVDVSDLLAKDILVMVLRRDGSGGNPDDTYTGNIYIASMHAHGSRWFA